MSNSSSKFAILSLIIISICVGLIIYFSTQFPVNNEILSQSAEDIAFEESIKDVEEVTVTEFYGDNAQEVAIEYLQAINEKDWATVEKYSKGMAKTLRNYKLSDMAFVNNPSGDIYEYSEENDEYVFFVEYSFDTQNEKDIQAIKEGKYFIVKVVDGVVKVNPLATSL